MDGSIISDGLKIKTYDVELSAGKGCFNNDEFLHSTMTMSSEMVQQYGLNANCVGAFVRGDSMEPQIKSGDTVIIDTSVETLENDGIYAFYYKNHCYIKQLQKLGHEIKVKSLNPNYDSWIITEDNISDFKIAGILKAHFSGKKI